MNNNTTNELLEQIINVLVTSITDKVTAKMEHSIGLMIDKKINEIDFSHIVADNIDLDEVARTVEGNLDFSDEVNDAVESAISSHDFSDEIKDALSGLTIKATITE
jgi:hypothetical protein